MANVLTGQALVDAVKAAGYKRSTDELLSLSAEEIDLDLYEIVPVGSEKKYGMKFYSRTYQWLPFQGVEGTFIKKSHTAVFIRLKNTGGHNTTPSFHVKCDRGHGIDTHGAKCCVCQFFFSP